MDRVCSVAYQQPNTMARTHTKDNVLTAYGTPRPMCTTSAAMVPKTLTMETVPQ